MSADTTTPTPEEVAHTLRLVEFVMERTETSLIVNCDRRYMDAVERDHKRLRSGLKMVRELLERLPPEPPMSPEREAVVGQFLGAVLDKRFGDGSQDAVDAAAADLFDSRGES